TDAGNAEQVHDGCADTGCLGEFGSRKERTQDGQARITLAGVRDRGEGRVWKSEQGQPDLLRIEHEWLEPCRRNHDFVRAFRSSLADRDRSGPARGGGAVQVHAWWLGSRRA